MTKSIAALAVLAGVLAPGMALAQEQKSNHGYGAGGLALMSSSIDDPAVGDTSFSGFGVAFNGAGVFNPGGPVGIGLTGGMMFGQRTNNNDDSITTGDFGLTLDAGAILMDLFYVNLGLNMMTYEFDDDPSNTTFTYAVVPLGVGLLKANDEGYLLGELRFGGGTVTLDSDFGDTDEDVGYFGFRFVGQYGAANSVQFMGALEFDVYDHQDTDATETFFRLLIGLGFGT